MLRLTLVPKQIDPYNFKKTKKLKIELIVLILTAILLYKVDFSVDNNAAFYFKKEDIYYEYQAAKQIQNNENPYTRILESNMIDNDKYATLFPLYFYLLKFIRQVSQDNFSGFIENLRSILFAFHLVGGLFIYLIFRRVNAALIGYTAAIFYLFNVWSLNSFIYLKQDMIAIALLISSYYFFKDKKFRLLAYILFGLSLGIKHIGIFAFPLYLTPVIFKRDSFKEFSFNMLTLLTVIIAPMAPFLVDNTQSFIKSMLFSLTRSPHNSEIFYGYTKLLVKYNPATGSGTLPEQLLPRLPLLIAATFGAVLLFLRKLPTSTYLFSSIMIFAIFNPVIFPQYITWIPPFALISVVDFYKTSDTKTR